MKKLILSCSFCFHDFRPVCGYTCFSEGMLWWGQVRWSWTFLESGEGTAVKLNLNWANVSNEIKISIFLVKSLLNFSINVEIVFSRVYDSEGNTTEEKVPTLNLFSPRCYPRQTTEMQPRHNNFSFMWHLTFNHRSNVGVSSIRYHNLPQSHSWDVAAEPHLSGVVRIKRHWSVVSIEQARRHWLMQPIAGVCIWWCWCQDLQQMTYQFLFCHAKKEWGHARWWTYVHTPNVLKSCGGQTTNEMNKRQVQSDCDGSWKSVFSTEQTPSKTAVERV